MNQRAGSSFFLQEKGKDAVILFLYIQPKASKTRFLGVHGNELKLAVTAPPVEGKANKAVLAFLAKFFNLSKSDVSIIKGFQSRHKQCRLTHVRLEDILDAIQKHIQTDST